MTRERESRRVSSLVPAYARSGVTPGRRTWAPLLTPLRPPPRRRPIRRRLAAHRPQYRRPPPGREGRRRTHNHHDRAAAAITAPKANTTSPTPSVYGPSAVTAVRAHRHVRGGPPLFICGIAPLERPRGVQFIQRRALTEAPSVPRNSPVFTPSIGAARTGRRTHQEPRMPRVLFQLPGG